MVAALAFMGIVTLGAFVAQLICYNGYIHAKK